MIIKMIEIYYIAAQPCEPMHAASKRSYRTPHLHIYHLKRRHFVTSYVQPIIQQYGLINNCLKRTFVIEVATTDDFHNKWKPSRAYHKIDTFRGKQR